MTRFVPGTTVQCRSYADYDCVFQFTVVSRTAKFVTLLYFGEERRVTLRTDSEGREYCLPLGRHSMSPMLYPEAV